MPNNLIERVLKTIRNYDMLKAGDKVLAAVSGGPDSVFLLRALNQLKGKLRIKQLAVCNLDHGLRGRESKLDSLFVRKISRELGLSFLHKKVNLRKAKSKELSTEEMAREERYKFFAEAATKAKATVIATGHTLDDQAETILMRLIKGSSLKGIVGISPVRKAGSFRIIRPLIELEKGEIERYLDEGRMPYRMDRTNLEPIYFRNVVRHEIIPFLTRYNPRLKRALFNLAEHLREDFQFIQEAKRGSRIKGHSSASLPSLRSGLRGTRGSRQKNGILEIKLKDIVIQPKALQKEIMRDLLDKAGGKVKRLSFRHWKELENFIKYKRKGNSIDLPGGIRVMRTATTLAFKRIIVSEKSSYTPGVEIG